MAPAWLGVLAGCGLLVGGLAADLHVFPFWHPLHSELHSPAASLSPHLSNLLSGASLKGPGVVGLTRLASSATAKGALDVILRGEIDGLVLQNLKLAFRIGKGTGATPDLSFFANLPSIRQLDIQDAEVLFTFEEPPDQVRLSQVRLTVRDYTPRAGGRVGFGTKFDWVRKDRGGLSAHGEIRGDLRLTGVDSGPSATGNIECVVEGGGFTSGDHAVALVPLTFSAEFSYDQQTETFAITRLRGESKSFGVIQGTARAVLRGEMPWSATVSATSFEVAQALGLLKPFLPEAYRAWTFQGAGAAETQVQGTLANALSSLRSATTVSLSQGGFSSPDGTKAAQGVSGTLALTVAYDPPEGRLVFNLRAEHRDGEYLWGAYYNNLAGRRGSLATNGSVSIGGDGRFELKGVLDVLQTGDYSFTASGLRSDWTAQVKAVDVSHGRIVETLLKEYLKGLSPRLASLSLSGSSSLEATIRQSGEATAISGTYRMGATRLTAPDLPLSIQEIAGNVPFDLEYPSSGQRSSRAGQPGFIRFREVQRKRLSVDDLQIPLVISQNRVEVPEPISVPFFGGHIRLYGVQINDALFPTQYRFGVSIASVDLGRMSRRLTGIEYPGTINADLGMMRYENNRIASEGKAVVGIFGGEIEATNLFAENLASAGRKFGGDIAFKNINLEELTRKVAIGKMTGVIRGSLRNFVMEYGEPASFVLEIQSVETRGVPQSISMDAIQSISILGTGVDSALNRGITQFFKEYPYSQIGLRCVLKNDQFSVNGTIHDGGKEYLVRRGFLRGVDVVNQNPQNVISFRDMEERVKRISRTPQVEPGGIGVE
jgi:hypothetical protein